MKKIIPSVIAKSQKELESRIKKVSSKTYHLDVMDGIFVKNKSLLFNFKPPKGKSYQAHLMIKNPQDWIKKHWKKASTIIFHIESCKSKEEANKIISLIKSKKREVGIAINPRTSVNKIKEYLSQLSLVLVMTVNPGKYGSKFLPNTLKKVRRLKKLKKSLHVSVDGSINPKTINSASHAGANSFVVGSYIQKSASSRESLKKLR